MEKDSGLVSFPWFNLFYILQGYAGMAWAAAYRFMIGSNKQQETGGQKTEGNKYAPKIHLVDFLSSFI